ncbi:MAG TPA: hypothetical protein VGQ83_03820 [Polyangia bacterium]
MTRAPALLALATLTLTLTLTACNADVSGGQSAIKLQEGVSGCHGHADSSVPASGDYYLTSFGNAPSDDGQMSCGSYTRSGSWYYAASRQRYGCGSKIKIEANGKCVVAQTDDYGPDECVERAAGKPIIDASPLVSKVLFGTMSAGWSDHYRIHVTEVADATPLGPCTGTTAPTATPPASATCHSATLDRDVAEGVCVQSASDGAWYHCHAGAWVAGASGCTARYAWCQSATLGRAVPPRSCVQSRASSQWFQCGPDGWIQPVSNGAGPEGDCSAEYPL